MLFTVLGVIALFLRERTIKSTVSGQEERFDRQEGLVTAPPVTNSDGREIGDWCEDSSLHLEEQINVQTEEPSLEEPVDDHSEEQSLVEPDRVHGEEQSLVEPDSVHGEESSLVEPVSVHGEEQSLVEPDSVHGEELSLVEPVDGHSEDLASSSSSDDVPPNIFYAESSSSDDFPQEFYSAGSKCSSELTASSYSSFFSAESGCGDDHSTDFLSAESGCGDDPSTDFQSAESGCGDDPSTDFQSAESGCGDDPPPNVVSAEPGCSHEDPPKVVSEKPGCSHDDPPKVVSEKPGCSHDDPPNVVSAEPGCSHDDPPNVVSEKPSCSHDDPPNVVSAEPGCSHDDPPNVVSAEPGCSHEDPPKVVSAKPGCSHDDPPKVVSAKPGCSHDDPPKVVSEKPGCSHDDPPNVVSAKPGCSHYPPTKVVPAKPGCKAAAQGATCQTKGAVPHHPKQLNYRNTHIMDINFKMYEIGAKLGKGGFGTVYTGTRIKDRLPVALKVADFKVKQFIQVDDFLQPLPAEIALHFLASKGPKAKPIVKLLDWKVEANRYLLVLERPVPCENLWEFLCKYDGRIPEKILWKIMFHTTIAADICCKRGVLHRDIKAENLLINLRTHQVKLTDFGCGERLTRSCYKEYCGTPQYCPPEFNSTGLYYGEPATVWSLGILQYLLMFKKFPDYHDLQNLTFTNLGQYGWSKECCDFISCCLQTDYKLRSKLQTLRTHDWFKAENKPQ
ncbi:uncharacterized protein si:ch211-122l14.5 [Danio rerio]|uniref:non-specific serine/threonine protein kinase n=1 Tax=Danio rerio TaxID=7955 RepID=A0AB32U2Y3_DANRE